MKVIYNRWIPFRGYDCINLFGVIFSRRKSAPSESVLRHESIHTRQMLEMLIFGFYLWYLVEWTIRLIRCRNWLKAYRGISFEQEAYAMEWRKDYLAVRRPYAWLHWLH